MLWQKTKVMVTLAKSGLSFSPIIKPGPGLAHSLRVCPETGDSGFAGSDTLCGWLPLSGPRTEAMSVCGTFVTGQSSRARLGGPEKSPLIHGLNCAVRASGRNPGEACFNLESCFSCNWLTYLHVIEIVWTQHPMINQILKSTYLTKILHISGEGLRRVP